MPSSVTKVGQMPNGEDVVGVTIKKGALTANFLNYGAVLQDLRLATHAPSLVLGFDRFDPYLTDSPYFGATAGRCANRIRDGHVGLNNKSYQLDQNFLGKHHLHGGSLSIGKRLWALEDASDSAVTLAIDLVDGEMGYPGNMSISATFSITDDATLDIQYSAQTDAPTLCNLAHHSYFNLDGSSSILDHELWIDADDFLPVDHELIPTGVRQSVDRHAFDFRTAKRIGAASDVAKLDHNFCLGDQAGALRIVARLFSPTSLIGMDILSTEPGLQIYDGAKIDIAIPGHDGMNMGAHAGVAIEPQLWPDAVHHAAFPSTVLGPDAPYHQHSQFVFFRL